MIAALLVLGLAIPRDTVLVSVELVPTGERITVEAIQYDSTLQLPSSALRDLLGVQMVGPWISLDQLRQAYPTVVVQWRPHEARVLVFDELSVLPSTRRFRETHRASAFGVAAIPQVSGPWGAFSVDDRKRSLAEAGYTYRGRATVFGQVDDRGAGQWNVAVTPLRRLFVGATGGTRQPTTVTGRITTGPVWLLGTFTPRQPLDVSGLVSLGPVQTYASRTFGMVTITPLVSWSLQVARTWATGRTVGRISFGPVNASPFSLPPTTLR